MRVLRLCAALSLLVGCAPAMPNLDARLENATDPELQVYEDQSIAIRFAAAREHLAFDLKNKTNGAIRILWDEIVFEDADGRRHAVCHSGVDFSDLARPQDPTTVPPRKRIQDRLIPKEHIAASKENPGQWDIAALLVPIGRDPSETRKLASEVVGKNVYVTMPLVVGGQRELYRFDFKITPVGGPSGRGTAPKHEEREPIDVIK
jgi:hypothetical protein